MDASTLVTIFISICIATVMFFKHKYKYWARKGVPFIPPQIPFGNMQNLLRPKESGVEVMQRFYNTFRREGHKHGGLYFLVRPAYMAVDADLIKNILSKDFQYFHDRGVYYDEKSDPLSAHLFSLEGKKWRNLRAKLTPTFTSGKMKMMFKTLLNCGDQMIEKIDELSAKREAIDSKYLLSCFTTDVIGSCAFGLDCNSFKDKDSSFVSNGKKLFQSNWSRRIRVLFIATSPSFSKRIGIRFFEESLTNFYMDMVRNVLKYREENGVVRNDFMQILMELKNGKGDGSDPLTIEEIAAQAFVFFLAGYETSSTVMSYCLYELTQNEDVQEKARKEILDVLGRHGGEFTYESVTELKYLGQVIDETLRKYPPAPTLRRKCIMDYKIPGTDITLDKDMTVIIPAYALHYDPEYFPDPEKFDPERFTEENRAKLHPFAYLPFGEGPRICIGLRFGLMQTRVGLGSILKNYKVKLHPRTILPIGLKPTSFLLAPKNDIFLTMEKI